MVVLPNWYGLRPNNQALAYFNLGNVALRQGDNVRAEALYDSASIFDPNLHQLYLNRGLAHLRQDQLNLASEDFHSEARLHPSDGGVATHDRGIQTGVRRQLPTNRNR